MFEFKEIPTALVLSFTGILLYQVLWYPVRRAFVDAHRRKAFIRRLLKRWLMLFLPVLFIFGNHKLLISIGLLLAICLFIYSIRHSYRALFDWQNLLQSKPLSQMAIKDILQSIRLSPLTGVRNFLACVLSFALVNLALYRYDPINHFTVSSSSASMFIDFLYFTTVTLATLGYGDIVPISATARLLLTFEVFSGTFFLIFLFGAIVSNHSRLVQALEEKVAGESLSQRP